MSPRRAPVSRRDRPAKAPLSRAGVVAAAMQIMQADGVSIAWPQWLLPDFQLPQLFPAGALDLLV